jgi:hypothetical protein
MRDGKFEKDLAGSGRGLIQGTIQEFSWMEYITPRRNSAKITCV